MNPNMTPNRRVLSGVGLAPGIYDHVGGGFHRYTVDPTDSTAL